MQRFIFKFKYHTRSEFGKKQTKSLIHRSQYAPLTLNGTIMNTQNENESHETEALCPECGHGFKTYMDRILNEGKISENKRINCPVCGCGECHIGK